MDNRNKEFSLIKFGVSEIKRKNLKQTYTLYTDWINEQGDCIDKKESDIFEEWKKITIYEEQKKDINIGREMNFLKSNGFIVNFKNIDKKNSFYNSGISKNWSNNNETLFYLKEIDYSFFLFLIKQKYWERNQEKSAFIHIIKYLLTNKKLEEDIIISNNYVEHIKNIVTNRDKKSIINLLKYKSGSPKIGGINRIDQYKKDEIRDSIIILYTDYYFENKINEHCLIKKIMEYFKKVNSIANAKIASGLLELIFRKTKNNDFKYQIKSLAELSYEEIRMKIIIQNEDDFLQKIKNRIVMGSYSDYKNLIVNHINCLSSLFDISKKNNELIFTVHDEKVEKFLFELMEKENELLKLKIEKFYTKKELIEKLNITIDENNNWENIDEVNDKRINEVYTLERIKNILDMITQAIATNGNTYNNKKIKDIIDSDAHVNGQVNWPTYYEFIIGIIFLKKTYGEYSKNWKDKIKRHLRLSVDGSLCPIRFASGGRADIFFKNDNMIYTIEPTTQLYRQTKQEYESVLDHLEKEIKNNPIEQCCGLSIIAAPKIESRLANTLSNHNSFNKNIQLLWFDNHSLIKILNSNHSNINIWKMDFLHSLTAYDFIKINIEDGSK